MGFPAGLTAPVGVTFSWRKIKSTNTPKEGGKSFSLFIPLIDLGALASCRMNNDSTKVASYIQLKNIISPGLYAYFGFGKYPIYFATGTTIKRNHCPGCKH